MGAGNLERENLSRKTRVRRPGQNPGGISNRKQQWQNLKDPLSLDYHLTNNKGSAIFFQYRLYGTLHTYDLLSHFVGSFMKCEGHRTEKTHSHMYCLF